MANFTDDPSIGWRQSESNNELAPLQQQVLDRNKLLYFTGN
ncbi:hypothetical protein [Paenibacillus andongensis]|nr:hypothetical protein [Paenibacillus andongensis]